jgi:hypothetical protein
MAAPALPYALLLMLAVTLVSLAGLAAWRQWLALKRAEMTGHRASGSRAEIGELRSRVRRLEALASGIEI